MKKIFSLLTRADKLLIVLLFITSILSLPVIRHFQKSNNSYAIIEVNAKELKKVSLLEEKELEIMGELGISILKIEKERIKIIKSPCPHKLCVKMGWISQPGEIIICIPNKVVVRIAGGDSAFDGISR